MKTSLFFRFLVKHCAREIIRAAYTGILSREPDEAGWTAYSRELRKTGNLDHILRDLAASKESWESRFYDYPDELVRLVYRGLLGREPDAQGLAHYIQQIVNNKKDGLKNVIRSVTMSREFAALESKRKEHRWPHPRLSYDHETWVFLHIEKTAGTSMQNMLVESYGAEKVYREHSDTLHLHCPAELSNYSVFAGHFNYDSLSFIPRRTLRLFTFVRNPKERLISLYTFWRAHEPNAPSYHIGMELANKYDIESFLNLREIARGSGTWNHMTWCIMGHQQWMEWREQLEGLIGKEREKLLRSIRKAIRRRLGDFLFVGLQEDFERSCAFLFRLMGRDQPPLRSDHSVETLSFMTRQKCSMNIGWPSSSIMKRQPRLAWKIDGLVYCEEQ